METTTIARIVDSQATEPELDSSEEEDLYNEVTCSCEAEEDYSYGDGHGALCPICIGDVIHNSQDQYRVDHRLGRGASSTVWLAYGSRQQRSVALKIMRGGDPGNVGDKEYMNQKMLREADIDKSHLNL